MEKGTLKIIRARYFNDKMSGKGFNVFIDGKDMGKVAYNEPKSYDLPIGEHKIYAKINWGTSPEMTINIKAGETKEIELGLTNPPTKVRFIIAMIFAIIYFGGLILGRVLHDETIKDMAIYSIGVYFLFSIIIYRKKSPLYGITFGRKNHLYLMELGNQE